MDKPIFRNSILLQMFYGRLSPNDIVETSKYYIECDNNVHKLESEFYKIIEHSPKLKSMYEEISNSAFVRECAASDDFFESGFRLGFLMALKVLGFKPPKDME